MRGQRRPTGSSSVVESLEALRTWLHRRLDAIEDLVHAGDDGQDDALVDSLREQLRRAEQWRQQHLEDLAQLEVERAQLAEAWERLERERTRSTARRSGTQGPRRAESPKPLVPGTAPREMENPVSLALLHQFKEVQGDVKRHAENRDNNAAG